MSKLIQVRAIVESYGGEAVGVGEAIMKRKARWVRFTAIVAISLLTFTSCSWPVADRPVQSMPGTTDERAAAPLIVDTDMGADDVIAILYLLQHPGVDLRAITVAGTGLAHCEEGVRHVSQLLEVGGAEGVPVACGSETPLEGERAFPPSYRSLADDFYGLQVPAQEASEFEGSAVDLLVTAIEAASGSVQVLTLGPLTNLAKALQREPALAERIDRVTIMGGAIDVPGNVALEGADPVPTGAEWNIYIDPDAAEVVLTSGIPITLVPLDATNQVPITRQFQSRLAAEQQTPASQYVFDLLQRNPAMMSGGFYFWDPLAAAVHLEENLATFNEVAIAVEGAGADRAGELVRSADGSSTRVVSQVDTEWFGRHVIATLTGSTLEGIGAENIPPEASAPTGNLLWSYDVEILGSGVFYVYPPQVLGDHIHLAGPDGDYRVLDRETGGEIWMFTTEGHVFGRIPIAMDTVYIAGTDGVLHAVDALTGDERWQFSTKGALGVPETAGDLVVMWSDDGYVHALDRTEGEELWNFNVELENDLGVMPPLDPGLAIDGDSVYFTDQGDTLYAIESRTGAVRWTHTEEGQVLNHPILFEDLALVASRQGVLVAVEQASGDELWRFEAENFEFSRPMIHEGRIYIVADGRELYSIEARSGRPVWHAEPGQSIQLFSGTEIAFDADRLFLRGHELDPGQGVVYALDTATGEVAWQYAVQGTQVGGLVASEGRLAFGTFNGDLQVLDAMSGTEVWQYETDGVVFAAPAIVGDVAYFISGWGAFLAVQAP